MFSFTDQCRTKSNRSTTRRPYKNTWRKRDQNIELVNRVLTHIPFCNKVCTSLSLVAVSLALTAQYVPTPRALCNKPGYNAYTHNHIVHSMRSACINTSPRAPVIPTRVHLPLLVPTAADFYFSPRQEYLSTLLTLTALPSRYSVP